MVHSSKNYIPYFLVTESFLKKRNPDHEVAVRDYSHLRADRPDIIKGGVILYTHNDFVIDERDIYADTICQAVMTYNSTINLLVIGIYRPPRADDKSFNACLKKISEFINKHDDADIHVMGDLNFRYINWETKEINKERRLKSEINCAVSFLSFMDKYFLNQFVTEFTRKDKSILDLVLTNNHHSIHSIEVDKTQLSDHDIVWTQLTYKQMMKTPNHHNNIPDSPFDNINLNKANWDNIRGELSEVNWTESLKEKNVEEIISVLTEKLTTSCSKHAPVREGKTDNKLHIPPKRRSLLKIRRRLNTKINICKYLKPIGHEKKLEKYNRKKAQVEIDLRDAIREEAKVNEMKAIEKIKKNPRAFFTYAKRQSKTHDTIGPLLDKENKLQSDPKTMSEILQNQYTKVFSDKESGDSNQPQQDTSQIPELHEILISTEDIIKAINQIGSRSAPGPDKIPAILLKECKNEIAPALVMLWQKSLDSGEIPSHLLNQTIIPIFKKENKSLPSNYRPISLTSHFIKIIERVIREKIILHIISHNLITGKQHGFMPNRSTLTQLLQHIDSILEILESNGNADILYLDMCKAFDKVNHKILLEKLSNMKITGKIHAWIEQFLTARSQQVVVNGYKSSPAAVQSGVPQGTVLGPVLFVIYMNNITEYVKSTLISMYADDSKLISSVKNMQDRAKIQTDLEGLIKWTVANSMEFNEGKFQLLQMGDQDDLKLPYQHNTTIINKSSHVKDLGILISEDMTFKHQISEMCDGATNFASWLLRTFRTRSKDVMLLLLKTYLIPRLEYCSAIWNPTQVNQINQVEAIQRTFTSKIENLDRYNYHERLKKLNLFSLQRRRERYILIHTFKIFRNLAPNDVNLQFHENLRLGTQCRRLPLKGKSLRLKTLRFNSFSHSAPRLFNLIPGEIKRAKTVDSFKSALDKLLMQIPDTPPTPGYKVANSNSLTEWGQHILKAKVKALDPEDGSLHAVNPGPEVQHRGGSSSS